MSVDVGVGKVVVLKIIPKFINIDGHPIVLVRPLLTDGYATFHAGQFSISFMCTEPELSVSNVSNICLT